MHAEASASWILQKLHFIMGGGIGLPCRGKTDAECHDFKDTRFARFVCLVFLCFTVYNGSFFFTGF